MIRAYHVRTCTIPALYVHTLIRTEYLMVAGSCSKGPKARPLPFWGRYDLLHIGAAYVCCHWCRGPPTFWRTWTSYLGRDGAAVYRDAVIAELGA